MTHHIEDRILGLLRERAPEASICPSEVARSLAGEGGAWRALMQPVRQAAAALAARGVVKVTQGAAEIDLARPVKGPVRIRRGPAFG